VNKGNLDLYATTSGSFSQGYSGLTSKKHTIVIKVTGTKDPASGNTNVATGTYRSWLALDRPAFHARATASTSARIR
jgi:hypothetical protein